MNKIKLKINYFKKLGDAGNLHYFALFKKYIGNSWQLFGD